MTKQDIERIRELVDEIVEILDNSVSDVKTVAISSLSPGIRFTVNGGCVWTKVGHQHAKPGWAYGVSPVKNYIGTWPDSQRVEIAE